jgi:hypothetical protein
MIYVGSIGSLRAGGGFAMNRTERAMGVKSEETIDPPPINTATPSLLPSTCATQLQERR